jgi:hypothetical protein
VIAAKTSYKIACRRISRDAISKATLCCKWKLFISLVDCLRVNSSNVNSPTVGLDVGRVAWSVLLQCTRRNQHGTARVARHILQCVPWPYGSVPRNCQVSRDYSTLLYRSLNQASSNGLSQLQNGKEIRTLTRFIKLRVGHGHRARTEYSDIRERLWQHRHRARTEYSGEVVTT